MEWNADPGCGRCKGRKIHEPHRRATGGDVRADSAIALEPELPHRSFPGRSAANGRSHQEQRTRLGCGIARFCSNVARGHGFFSVWLAYGYRITGSAGRAWGDTVHYRYFWNIGVFGQQAAEGIGNSHGPWSTVEGSAWGGARTID